MQQKLPKRIRDYLREQEACCKPSTVAGYRVNLSHFRDWLQEIPGEIPFRKKLEELTKPLLRNYLAYLNGKNLVPYSRVTYLLSVKKYLAWEVDCGLLKEDLLEVLDRKHLPKVPEYLPRPLSSENDRLLQKILRESDNPYTPLFLLLRQTGMRISELINLPQDCVVANGHDEKYLKVPLGKMNTERLVPLTGETLALIDRIRNAPPLQAHRRNQTRLIGLAGPVSSVYRLLAHRFEKLLGDMTDQGKPVTFHRLRHTYATSLLTGGVSLVSLMKLLGHRRIEMTLRYAKVTPTHLRDEYLKAIRVLENQSAAGLFQTSAQTTSACDPSEIIARLASFLIKASRIDPAYQKNLLRRLRRLQQDFSSLTFSQKFKLDFV